MPTTDAQRLVLVRASEAEMLPVSGVTLLTDAGATNGVLTSHRSLFRDGAAGAPPHFHTRASELFFILDGSLQVLTGDSIVTLNHGDFLVVPPNLPHAFAVAPGYDAEVLFVLAPGTPRFDYYRLVEQVYRGETDPKELAGTQDLYDNHYVDSPVWAAAQVRGQA